MGGRRPEGNVTDPRNKRMEKMSSIQRRLEASSEEAQDPESAVASQMDGHIWDRINQSLCPYKTKQQAHCSYT